MALIGEDAVRAMAGWAKAWRDHDVEVATATRGLSLAVRHELEELFERSLGCTPESPPMLVAAWGRRSGKSKFTHALFEKQASERFRATPMDYVVVDDITVGMAELEQAARRVLERDDRPDHILVPQATMDTLAEEVEREPTKQEEALRAEFDPVMRALNEAVSSFEEAYDDALWAAGRAVRGPEFHRDFEQELVTLRQTLGTVLEMISKLGA